MTATDEAGRAGAADADGAEAGRVAQVLVAAARVFAERGYRATSMRDLADAVGLSKAGLYHHVRRKEDVLVRLYEHQMAQHLNAETAIAAQGLEPEPTLRLLLRERIVFGCEHGPIQKVYAEEQGELPPDIAARLDAHRRARAELLVGVIERGVTEGVFQPAVTPRIAVNTMLGAVNFVYRWYDPGGERTPEELADEMADYLIAGLRPVSAPVGRRAGRSRSRTR